MKTKKYEKTFFEHFTKWTSILFTVCLCLFLIWGLKEGIFTKEDRLKIWIQNMGILAPACFILVQIIQVIFPVIPGGASCLLGVLLFGPTFGFLYNYIGLTIGSICAFSLSKKYGKKIVHTFFSEKSVSKYTNKIQNKSFDKIFFWGIFLPGAPDDLLCYLAGLTSMSKEKFTKIILLGKPLSLLGYSFGFLFLPFLF